MGSSLQSQFPFIQRIKKEIITNFPYFGSSLVQASFHTHLHLPSPPPIPWVPPWPGAVAVSAAVDGHAHDVLLLLLGARADPPRRCPSSDERAGSEIGSMNTMLNARKIFGCSASSLRISKPVSFMQ